MDENINLCKILKGHEGETFYSESLGSVKLHKLESTAVVLITNKHKRIAFKCALIDAEDDLFPSKDQRDWNKWDEEQNDKTPKTWSEFANTNYDNIINGCYDYCIDITGNKGNGWTRKSSPIEKSALAFLKIHQLIEHSYGGNISNEEWIDRSIKKYCITFDTDCDFYNDYSLIPESFTHISFHTKEQAEEFLSYPENVQLLKDYFMI